MQKVVLVLALGVLLSELRPGAEGRSPGFGLKLCGREFLRAVIFTCGGSRWKRSGEKLEGDGLEWTGEDEGVEGWEINPDDQLSRSRRSILEDALEALRSKGRKGRDVMIGLSNACCKWGCTKSEISSMC
ncbi:relaxin-3 isoform X2 [Callorhinchus milii]|uniref:Relaxin-3 n=1 Tax=Callorhinchus milii TaxID=7868 RepID=V9LHZ5_CALMI|nr:relaxin-3 isoform X2 [Callorhinchus milii]|eukprot:gi/632984370/ref/XP_007909107.1/ PREDICTED: relaxin-3 isoform X3 [Callorhinchus milii]